MASFFNGYKTTRNKFTAYQTAESSELLNLRALQNY